MTHIATVDFKSLRVVDTPRPVHTGYAVTGIDGATRRFTCGQEPACLEWLRNVNGIIELTYD